MEQEREKARNDEQGLESERKETSKRQQDADSKECEENEEQRNLESEENSEESRCKISRPLTPNSIPQSELVRKSNVVISTENKVIANPLDFKPTSTFTSFIKIPGILVFSILAGYLIGKFHFNFIFLIPVAHILYYIFNRKVTDYTRTLEAVYKEKSIKEKLGDFETVEWMNHITNRFWNVAEQEVSSIIFNEVNNILETAIPTKALSIRLSEITLGTRPPVVERISFLEKSEDCIVLEIAANFIPVQASEEILSYFKKQRNHWNTYIELTVVLGNFIKIPILVKNFTFSGIFKIKIGLTKKIPFASSFSLSMLETPVIDFELLPLKAVDMLDLPYVGSLLNGVINSQVKNLLLDPKSIDIDLEKIAKYQGSIIGVVYVYVHGLETVDESTFWVDIDIGSRVFGSTCKKFGKDPIFNQGFYHIVSDMTSYLTLSLQSTDEPSRSGKIWLRNLNKYYYSERVCVSDESSKRYIGVTSRFYPLTKRPSNTMILYLSLISIEDLQAIGDPINKLYSTYCVISVETREAIVKRRILDSQQSKRIFATKNPFYNQKFKFFVKNFEDYVIKVRILNERNDNEIGKVLISVADVKGDDTVRYQISGAGSGDLNLKFKIDYIDDVSEETGPNYNPFLVGDEIVEHPKNKDETLSEVLIAEDLNENGIAENAREEDGIGKNEMAKHDAESTSLSSEINEMEEHAVPEVKTKTEYSENSRVKEQHLGAYIGDFYKKNRKILQKEEKPEVPSLALGIYNKTPANHKFVVYRKAYKYSIKDIKASGAFYLVFETDHLNVRMDTFSTELKIVRDVIVPIENERYIRARLFKQSFNGDIFVSEEVLLLGQTVVVFDKTKVEFRIEVEDFKVCRDQDSDYFKVLQARFYKYSVQRQYNLDLFYEDEFQNASQVYNLSTLFIGSGDITCKLNEKNSKKNFTAIIPKRNCDEQITFGNLLNANICCMCLECPFIRDIVPRRGDLEVFIIKVFNLKQPSDSSGDSCVKVFLNNEKIFKTAKRSKLSDPIFNESFKINVQKDIDVLSFHVYSCNTIAADTLLCYREVSLFNILNGYNRYDINLFDGESGEMSDCKMQLIFNYKKDLNLGEIQ